MSEDARVKHHQVPQLAFARRRKLDVVFVWIVTAVVALLSLAKSIAPSKGTEPAVGQKSTILVQPLALARNIPHRKVRQIVTFGNTDADRYCPQRRQAQAQQQAQPRPRRARVASTAAHVSLFLSLPAAQRTGYSKVQALPAPELPVFLQRPHRNQIPLASVA